MPYLAPDVIAYSSPPLGPRHVLFAMEFKSPGSSLSPPKVASVISQYCDLNQSCPAAELEWRVGLAFGDKLRDGSSVYIFLGLIQGDRLAFFDTDENVVFTRPLGDIWIASLDPFIPD